MTSIAMLNNMALLFIVNSFGSHKHMAPRSMIATICCPLAAVPAKTSNKVAIMPIALFIMRLYVVGGCCDWLYL